MAQAYKSENAPKRWLETTIMLIKPKAVYGIHKDKNIQHNPAVQKTAPQY